MIKRDYDIVNSYERNENVELNPARLTNLFVEDDPGGKKGKAIFQTPGLKLQVTFIGTGIGRAARVFNNAIHASVGQHIFAVDSLFNYSNLGTIGTDEGYVDMTDNGRQITYVDGTGGWLFNKDTSVFAPISGVGFPSFPQSCTTFAARTIVNNADTNKVFFSNQNDSSTWDILADEFALTSKPDKVVGVSSLSERLFVFGTKTTELWYDAGDPVLPFRRADVLAYGCAAVGSIVTGFGFLLWLANDESGVGSVMITKGTEPESISNKAILQQFKRYEHPEDARAFVYRNDFGHICYQINFTQDNASWLFDITDKRWSQLKYNGGNRHLAQAHAYFNSKHYVLNYQAPILYELSNQFFTDAGVNIRREIVGKPIFDRKYDWIVLSSLFFDMRHGVGVHTTKKTAGTDNYNPTLRLRISRDGGLNYGAELRKPVGQVGRRTFTTRFQRLGRARSFVPKVTYDDDTEFVLLGASVILTVQQEGL